MKVPVRTELQGLGFELSGRFMMDGNKVITQITAHRKDTGVYVFVLGDAIKYVGETSNGLYQRAYQHSKPGKSQGTNIRVNQLLKVDARAKDAICEIWFLPDTTIARGHVWLDLGGTRLEGIPDRTLVKRTLIPRWDPSWNRR